MKHRRAADTTVIAAIFLKKRWTGSWAAGTPYVIRQKMPVEGSTTFHDVVYGDITIENRELEDQILLKSDGYPTYNFANVIDDHLMHITHVVRGCRVSNLDAQVQPALRSIWLGCADLCASAPDYGQKRGRQRVQAFQAARCQPVLPDLMAEGYLPQAITNYIALLGWCPKENRELFTLPELVENFSIEGISKSPAVFDYDKLTWFNAEYIRAMTQDEFIAAAMPYFQQVFGDKQMNWEVLASILQPRVTKLTEIPGMIGFFQELPEYSVDLFVNKKSKTNLENSVTMLEAAIPELKSVSNWQLDTIHDQLIALAQRLEVKNGTLLWPVRIAAAGMQVTPGGAMEILAILGKEESLHRLEIGLEKLKK